MSGSKSSYLSDKGYGCDFVVATTQASINSNLWEYLAEGSQPVEYIAFLSDPRTGLPTMETSLEDLLKKTGGVSPFDIPAGTPYSDSRIKYLNKARFAVGIKIQMGIPPGCTPDNSPPIVILGRDPSKVTLNMFCSQITVIQNHKDQFDEDLNSWNVWSQSAGDPWIIQSQVDLVIENLDKDLDQSEYLKKNEKIRNKLRDALDNLSGTAFSLQQLLFDLDNAILQNNYTFARVPDNFDAKFILETRFLQTYANSAKDHGWPLVSVTAVSQPRDDSTMQMTAFERTVSPLKDDNGNRIQNPDATQQSATTLNYLCVTDNHPRPSADTSFPWNWVRPEDINQESGVVAINRNTLAKSVMDKLRPQVAAYCYLPRIDDQAILLLGPQDPKGEFFETGAFLGEFKHEERVKGEVHYTTTAGQMQTMYIVVSAEYGAEVRCYDETIAVDQWVQIGMYWGLRHDEDWWKTMLGKIPIRRTLRTQYDLSVDENGRLQLLKAKETATSDDDGWESGAQVYPNGMDEIVFRRDFYLKLYDQITALHSGELHELELGLANNFVFPGARVFTYKKPSFSNNQDLICEVTYVEPTRVSSAQKSQPQPKPPSQSQSRAVANETITENPPYPPKTGTKWKLTASTELMQNYVHGEVVSPTGKFEALQTSDGHALLFAIDSSGVFHVMNEQSGTLHTGWLVHDLSTTAIQNHFPRQGSTCSAIVRTFDVGQSVVDGSIGLMMVVHVDNNDHLFTSLGNSNNDTSWAAQPEWTMTPFDPEQEPHQTISITNTLFAETTGNKQYLVVDINRPSRNSTNPHITRYHIDPKPAYGPHWVKHDIAIDIAAGHYQSAVGRVSGKLGDGIYTAGITAGGQPQLIYEPIVNYYGAGPVSPRRIRLPQGAIPSAIATARNPDQSTDLYAVGGQTLYRLPADEQEEHINPKALLNSDVLSGTSTLRVMIHDGLTILWGLNASNQVFYVACPTNQLAEPGAWGAPMPILSEVERMSPYVNRVDGGNTIFAASNGRMQKLMQGSAATGGIWRAQEIILTVPQGQKQKSTSFKSYTTSIHVRDSEKDLPASRTEVNLSASTRTPVYINGVYYVLSPTPIKAITDATGFLTIVETTDSLHAAVLTASLDMDTVTISPMDQTFDKITALDSLEKLRGAQLPSNIVAGGVLESPDFTSLIPSTVTDADAAAVAQHMSILKEAYMKLGSSEGKSFTAQASTGGSQGPATATMLHSRRPMTANFGFLGGLGHTIGDIGKKIVHNIEDGARKAEKVGEKIGHDLGDAARDAEEAAEKLGKAIGDAADKAEKAAEKLGKAIGDAAEDAAKHLGDAAKHLADAITSNAGDIFQWAKNEGEKLGKIVRDSATGMLHIIAKIGNKIYHAALDSAHAVMGAAQWIFDKIKTGIEDLAHYAEMLFHWGDIRRSKDVMHNLIKLWMQDQVDNIPRVQRAIDRTVAEVEGKLNDWAEVADWAPNLGGAAKKPMSGSGPDLSQKLTPSSKFLSDKYRDHASQMQILGDSPSVPAVENLLNDLVTAISNEGQVLGELFTKLKDIVSRFNSLTVVEILQQVMALVADGILSSMQVVVDALLKMLCQLAHSALNVLDTKIHIPVISDILNAIGISDISILDLFTWIGATAFTVIYKITVGHAPFADGAAPVQAIVSARSWAELAGLFGKPSTAAIFSASSSSFSFASFAATDHAGVVPMDILWQSSVFQACNWLAAILCFVGNSLQAMETEDQTGNLLLAVQAPFLGLCTEACSAAGSFLVPMDPIQSLPFTVYSYMIKGLGISAKIVFSGIGQKLFKAVKCGCMVSDNSRGLGAIVESALVFHSFVVTVWHCYELVQLPDDSAKDAAIVGEMAEIASYVSKVCHALAVNDQEQSSRLVAIIGMAAANDVYSAFKITEARIGASAFDYQTRFP